MKNIALILLLYSFVGNSFSQTIYPITISYKNDTLILKGKILSNKITIDEKFLDSTFNNVVLNETDSLINICFKDKYYFYIQHDKYIDFVDVIIKDIDKNKFIINSTDHYKLHQQVFTKRKNCGRGYE